jgi:o-succinylbenzoate---CoA ligase
VGPGEKSELTNELIPDWLANRASVLPAHPAVVAGDLTLTYRELNGRALGLAGALQQADVRPGDRVAVLCNNSLELVEAMHAVPRAGAVVVPLNCRLTPEELAFQLHDADVRLLLCHEATRGDAEKASMIAGREPPLVLPLLAAFCASPADRHALGDAHSIIYTSGTTGRPKGAVLTFGNFAASAAGSAFNLGVTPADQWLACMPLFHVGGLSIVLRSAIYGTTMVLQPGFDEHEVVRALHEQPITHISVVPTMLQRVLDADDRPSPLALRVVLVGGGPVPSELLERALARGFPVIQTYGLTEAASQVATLSPADARTHLGSAGKPLVTTGLRIDAPGGGPGEILVGGSTITPGYFHNPEATAATIQDGWLHTGDIGRLDEDGFLYVLDRRDDLVVSGGENVYPAEVEAALLSFPGVLEAAVFGVADPRWGQVVAAAIVANEALDEVGLEAFLRARLAGYKIPRVVRRVESLPRTASGKIQRRLVREKFESTLSG